MVERPAPNILAFVHLYPPAHNAGAELYLHTVLRYMKSAGANIRVIVRDQRRLAEWQGIWSQRANGVSEHYQWADIVITHLDCTGVAAAMAQSQGKPIVHLVHNDRQLHFHNVDPEQASLIVWNSQWIADKLDWPGASMVVVPPILAEDYLTTPGDAITLVNLSLAKGVKTFEAIARLQTKRRFIGVLGGYGHQLWNSHLPNIEYVAHTPDMRAVYAQTRILLMPSNYESWGRVGIEAAVSGIPTIAHPTPGLLESLGSAGIFCDRDKPEEWVKAIKALDNSKNYRAASEASRARALELDPAEDLERLRLALWELAGAVV